VEKVTKRDRREVLPVTAAVRVAVMRAVIRKWKLG
jgi:hypothetical protein